MFPHKVVYFVNEENKWFSIALSVIKLYSTQSNASRFSAAHEFVCFFVICLLFISVLFFLKALF